jgi:hypothetical protein
MNNIKPIIFGILGASIVTNVVLAVELHRQKKLSVLLIEQYLTPETKEEEKADE